MTTKTKGRNGGDRPTPKTTDSRNLTTTDPLDDRTVVGLIRPAHYLQTLSIGLHKPRPDGRRGGLMSARQLRRAMESKIRRRDYE